MPRPVRHLAAAVAALGLAACAGTPRSPEPAEVVSLGQGWAPVTAATVHHTPQGTLIMPTAWLSSLEAGPFSREPLLSPSNMRRFGFITDGPEAATSSLNPYGMPLGFASTGTRVPVDPADPKVTVEATGFTCAACHTGQLEYEGKALRVEGGQAYHDARAFQDALAQAVVATWLLPPKYARFRAKAIERGYPADKIDARFKTAFDAAWGGIKARLKREPDLYPTYEGPGAPAHRQPAVRRGPEGPREQPDRRGPGQLPLSLGHLAVRLGAVQRLGPPADGAQRRRGPGRERPHQPRRRGGPAEP